MPRFYLDLHMHSALSPCAENEMLPEAVLAKSCAEGIDIIALTDHNTAGNTASFVKAARRYPVTVIPGLEVQTREEVHLTCLFPDPIKAEIFQDFVFSNLPKQKNDTRIFGDQLLVDKTGQIIGEETQLLLTSTILSVEQAVNKVNDLEGICIPAHVDRPVYSIIASLGFIPPELNIPAVEISRLISLEKALEKFPFLKNYPVIASSDAHRLEEITRPRTSALLQKPNFEELREMFKKPQERLEVD